MADAANATKWGQRLQHPGQPGRGTGSVLHRGRTHQAGPRHAEFATIRRPWRLCADGGRRADPEPALFMEGKQSAADSLKKGRRWRPHPQGKRCRECSWACRAQRCSPLRPSSPPGTGAVYTVAAWTASATRSSALRRFSSELGTTAAGSPRRPRRSWCPPAPRHRAR